MPPYYELAVARFLPTSASSSSSPCECSRWAITVTFTSSSPGGLLYQITGTQDDYALAAPASVTLSSQPNSPSSKSPTSPSPTDQNQPAGYRYASKVAIGYADAELLHNLHSTLAAIPIRHGDAKWGTHEWVMQGADALRKVEGFLVERHVSTQWIKDKFGEK
ncbi:hypothetical protein SCLCIDRAFT_1213188 [Scleroderma citrinum Foug A]|uniref:Uncharacterized protein n=1 Tax=Scleroderma citrinum Foug A TaxID=1036808 RepID=A0A0C3E9N2_9AGAM|nr:hypothetical protein SCLCIDRAFT_1213188 [Scleroderma citrinum Foug A]